MQLRKSATKHWLKLDADSQNTLKSIMLERIVNEEHHLVRKNAASVVSAIAKKALVDGGWPELLDFLTQCAQSEQADHREVALMVFEALAEIPGEHLQVTPPPPPPPPPPSSHSALLQWDCLPHSCRPAFTIDLLASH